MAPVFWYLLLGLPGLVGYKMLNTLDSMTGYRNERYEYFGKASARLDDIANWIPARLTALLIVFATLILRPRHVRAAIRAILVDAAKHRSPNAGWPEAAMAGALGVRLAGPRIYPHGIVDDPWIGDGGMGEKLQRASATHLRLGLRVYWLAISGLLALLALVIVFV